MRQRTFTAVCGIGLLAGACSAPDGVNVRVEVTGGEVRVDHPESRLFGTALRIPPGALAYPAEIQITGCDDFASAPEVAAGPCVRLLPSGLVFNKPATLTMPYSPAAVPATADLTVKHVFDTAVSTIPQHSLEINEVAKAVAVQIDNMGDYQPTARIGSRPPPTRDVDILFVVDNSPSMSPKQRALAQAIPKLFNALDRIDVDYHIAITTSDVGTNASPGMPWGGNIGACDTFEGDDGVLQNTPCTARFLSTAEARSTCTALCPNDRFIPSGGGRYLSKTRGVTNVPVDLRRDPMTGNMVDMGPANAFRCIGLVGDGGCGAEGTFEGARRALDGHRIENLGFLRKDSLLAVVFLTDEDDCSVQLARRSELKPSGMRDCSTPEQNADFSCYGLDYRCLARSVQCNEPMNTPGVKTGCHERAGNFLEPPSKYTNFLRSLRPVSRLVVAGLWTQPALDKGGNLRVFYASGGNTTPFLNRAPGSDASCFYKSNPNVFGQAQLRLSLFAAALRERAVTVTEGSICELDDYGATLEKLAADIESQLTM